MKLALGSVVLLCAVCAVFCYRAPQGPGGSYSLPSIGKYPSPTVFNPKNHGLPDAYKNYKFKRSVEVTPDLEFAEEPSIDELSRQKRSPNKFILPTYRPPRKGPPKIYQNYKFKRSVEVTPDLEFAEEPSIDEDFRFKRSVDDQVASKHEQFAEEPALEELSRQRRSPDPNKPHIIYPTYRPPPRV